MPCRLFYSIGHFSDKIRAGERSRGYGIFENAYKDTEINDLEWYEKLIKNKVNNL